MGGWYRKKSSPYQNEENQVSGVGHDILKKSGKYSCTVFCSDVGNNSIQCSQYMLWVHKRYRGITKRLVAVPNYVCRMCNGEGRFIDGAVTVPLLPDVVWLGKVHEILASPDHQTPSHLGYWAKCMRSVFSLLQ